jgi:D-alanyl-lipoteichoic acid acyltransferase DltB (MBOAT superfamily)
VTRSLTEEDYSLINFLAYCLYPPLYIAGPIITFNDFVWQVSTRHEPDGLCLVL